MPRNPLGYELHPIYEDTGDEPKMVSAAAMVCAVTGVILAGSGGGGVYVSPRVFRALARGEIQLDGQLEDDSKLPDPEVG